jgi:hypothetical protein
MLLVMLPRNPFPENFCQLLDTFRSSEHIHRLIKLNLDVGAILLLHGFGNGSRRLILKLSPVDFLLTGPGEF